MSLVRMNLGFEPPRPSKRDKILRWGELVCLIVGFVCLGIFGGQRVYDAVYQSYENYEFNQSLDGKQATITGYLREKLGLESKEESKEIAQPPIPSTPEPPKAAPQPRKQLAPGELVGRVVIPRLGISAMVNEGTDNKILARAVGHVPSTARPGEPGTVALAAHRDTHFRPVRNITKGDTIQMETADGTFEYRVEKMWVVTPKDISVLRPTEEPSLTLITCYPFNFIGHAPKRYIVRATQVGVTPRTQEATAQPAPVKAPMKKTPSAAQARRQKTHRSGSGD